MKDEKSPHLIGVDVGGTKIAAGLVGTDGTVLQTVVEPIRTGDMFEPLHQIAEMSRRLCAGKTPLAMGLAVPAVVNRQTGHVIWAPNIPAWRDVPVGDFLGQELGCSIHLDFDGHVSVLGEQWVGAGAGSENVVFLIVGTGVGAGMWLGGSLYRGASGIAGGVGWYPLSVSQVEKGEVSRRGFFEERVAGPGLARTAREALLRGETSILSSLVSSPVDITARHVFDAYEAGDSLARRIVDGAVDALGFGISCMVSTLNPEVVIVGGGVGIRMGQLNLFGRLEEIVRQYSQPQAAAAVRIVAPKLSNLAGVVGAARLALLEM